MKSRMNLKGNLIRTSKSSQTGDCTIWSQTLTPGTHYLALFFIHPEETPWSVTITWESWKLETCSEGVSSSFGVSLLPCTWTVCPIGSHNVSTRVLIRTRDLCRKVYHCIGALYWLSDNVLKPVEWERESASGYKLWHQFSASLINWICILPPATILKSIVLHSSVHSSQLK